MSARRSKAHQPPKAQKDPCDFLSRLPHDWWNRAMTLITSDNAWSVWKQRFQLIQEFERKFYENYNRTQIIDHEKGNDLMNIFSSIMLETSHQATEVAILKILPCLINSFPVEKIAPHQHNIIKAICTKHWTYTTAKSNIFDALSTKVELQPGDYSSVFMRNRKAENSVLTYFS
eukprot:953191_1